MSCGDLNNPQIFEKEILLAKPIKSVIVSKISIIRSKIAK